MHNLSQTSVIKAEIKHLPMNKYTHIYSNGKWIYSYTLGWIDLGFTHKLTGMLKSLFSRLHDIIPLGYVSLKSTQNICITMWGNIRLAFLKWTSGLTTDWLLLCWLCECVILTEEFNKKYDSNPFMLGLIWWVAFSSFAN